MEGKARAVSGMRRAGKTTFLYQCLAARLANRVPSERFVYFNFEDEHLADFESADLGMIFDEYYRSYPSFTRPRHFLLRRANHSAGIHRIPAADPQHPYGLSRERLSTPLRQIRISP